MRPLRIVHATPFYWPSVGGGEGQVKAISDRLAARGHRVTVITRKQAGVTQALDPALPTREVIDGVTVHRLRVRRWPEVMLESALRLPGGWRLLARCLGTAQLRGLLDGPMVPEICWHVRRARPDVVVYSNYYFPGMAYGLLGSGRLSHCPHVGIPLLHLDEHWSTSPTTIDLLRRSSALFANTPYEARFIESVGVPPAAVHVLGGGVDDALFASPRGAAVRKTHELGTAPVIGYVGRLSANKGVVTLLEAMRIVWRAVPTTRLLLAGRRFAPDSDTDRPIAEAFGRLTPEEKRRVICRDDFLDADKASLYDALDVFAMPSTAESFGIAFLEAWMCGKPVVGARIGAVECVVDHGVDGLLAAPGDACATAEAILTLLADPDRRRRFGAAGRAKTLSRFTWDRLTDVAENVYAKLAGARPA